MVDSSIEAYIARQPHLGWRRQMIRTLIRTLGFRVLWRVEVAGTANIPAAGPTVLMMNHISGIDPILCMGAVRQRFVIPMTKIENAQHPILGKFVRWYGAYTVTRGEVDRTALTNSIELLKSGQLILIAPEGTRTPTGLIEPKDGLAYVATKSGAVIVPAAVSGAVGWEAKLKARRRAQMRLDFGKPFVFNTGGRARIPRAELAQMTREAMYQLALTLPDSAADLRGVYGDLRQATTETLTFV